MFTSRIKAALVTAVVLALSIVTGGYAATYTFSTADNKLGTGNNSGWWAASSNHTDPNEDNYMAGKYRAVEYRNFFSFNLDALDLTGMRVDSATLSVPLGSTLGSNFTYTLYDVSTDVSTLNNTVGTNESIYNDLGSGVSYGSFPVSLTSPLVLNLNASALTAISNKGWFSIGGVVTSPNTGDYYLFGNTGNTPVVLNVETVNIPAAPAVPEPATILGFGVPMLMLGLNRLRRLHG